jgi:TraM recognition site of TraD and TraG
LERRAVLNLAVSLLIGVTGLQLWPFPGNNVFLAAIHDQNPSVFRLLTHGYATLWFTTPWIVLSIVTAALYVAVMRGDRRPVYATLPPYPKPTERPTPYLVLGEQHHDSQPGRSERPRWLTIPRRGLHTGVMIFGAVGTGKTSACMYPYVEQLLAWRASSPDERIGGLVLEVKGDFCGQVRRILGKHGRENDYLEIGLESAYCYNPLNANIDAYALAYSIATLLNNLYGRGKEPFWQQAYTDLVKFIILLRKVVDGYTTLAEVYQYAMDETLIQRDLERGARQLAVQSHIEIAAPDQVALNNPHWSEWSAETNGRVAHPHSAQLEAFLRAHNIPFTISGASADERILADRRHQLAAVKRWYYGNWVRLENKLRSSIVEGIVVFLSLFDDNPALNRAFCPPKSAYSDRDNQTGKRPLPPLEQILESGKVLALNFPVSLNPGLARALGVMVKLDFQRAVLSRVPRIAAEPKRLWRDILFVCDEYHAFATTGETDPTGDERTFALSRQARLIPIVATQSISSLRSALHGDEAWRTLLQCFRTKIFLASSDEYTARVAADLCGKAERLKPSYQLTEAGQDARVSLLTGRAAAPKSTVTASKHYAFHLDYVFQPKVFGELQNGEAIVLPYDGLNPLPPTFCYLKPHYLDVHTSYFDHVARGVL